MQVRLLAMWRGYLAYRNDLIPSTYYVRIDIWIMASKMLTIRKKIVKNWKVTIKESCEISIGLSHYGCSNNPQVFLQSSENTFDLSDF